jgi:hypothetical protein
MAAYSSEITGQNISQALLFKINISEVDLRPSGNVNNAFSEADCHE